MIDWVGVPWMFMKLFFHFFGLFGLGNYRGLCRNYEVEDLRERQAYPPLIGHARWEVSSRRRRYSFCSVFGRVRALGSVLLTTKKATALLIEEREKPSIPTALPCPVVPARLVSSSGGAVGCRCRPLSNGCTGLRLFSYSTRQPTGAPKRTSRT